ncbi:hypothetical protein VKT23_004875 [Stygiomarasmius scandens]|uniref:F-box domain-containing protein n=1 Tax=Marasmiellus scandens TaxID=2682957 RepID=A0ABR1JRH7_9AGAR
MRSMSRNLCLPCPRLSPGPVPSASLPHEILVAILLHSFDATSIRKQGLDTINLVCQRIRADYYIRQETYKFLCPNIEDSSAFIKVVLDIAVSRHIVFLNLINIPVGEKLEELLQLKDGLNSAIEAHLCLRGYAKPFSDLFTHAFIPSCQNLVLDFDDIERIGDERFHFCLRPLTNLKHLSLSAFVHDTDDGEWTHFWDINGLVLNKCMPFALGSGNSYQCEQEASPSPLALLAIKATFGWEFPCDLQRWIDGCFDFRFVPVFESKGLRELLENRELEDEWTVGDLNCFLLEKGITANSSKAAAEFWEQGLSISKDRRKHLDSLNI